MLNGPILNETADGAGPKECGRLDCHADTFGDFDDGLYIILVRARRAVGRNIHARVEDFTRQGFRIGKGASTRAGEADITVSMSRVSIK
jgi:hypothetical protein